VKYFIKRYSLLVVAQTACLALGLWLEHRFSSPGAPADLPPSKPASALVNDEAAASGSQESPSLAAGNAPNQGTPSMALHVIAFVWITALQAIVAYLVLMRDQEENFRKHQTAERVSWQQYNELLRTRDAVIFGLAKLAESRDSETGNHLERIAIYSTRLASAARLDPRYRGQITASFVKLIGISSALHDIGKVGIRDSILLKPGKLEQQEQPHMQSHVTIGGKCVHEIESRLGKSNFLSMAREIAFSHHEHWDGTGYPRGLSGEEIPLAARIVAVADVYDALSTKRIYREACPHEKCVEIIREGTGKQFDPGLVEIFLNLEAEFRDIALSCRDVHESLDEESLSAPGTAEIDAETAASVEDSFSLVQDLLDQCAGDPPASGRFPPEAHPSPEESRRSSPYPVCCAPENSPSPE
jgi:HD-GYP domain-containing protein (c-di-GMP phosphodiesterase class II)